MTLYDALMHMATLSPAAAIVALFILLGILAALAVGVHDAIAWWWNRGLSRRRARLNGERS